MKKRIPSIHRNCAILTFVGNTTLIFIYWILLLPLSGRVFKTSVVTRTWFEHATFWTGVRRATVAPPGLTQNMVRSKISIDEIIIVWKGRSGPTEIWTRIAGFRVLSANHYTIGPCANENIIKFYFVYVKILLFAWKTQGNFVFHTNTSLIIHIFRYHRQIYLFQPFSLVFLTDFQQIFSSR